MGSQAPPTVMLWLISLRASVPQVAWAHIKDMVVRGAPAIGVTGALSLAVDLVANKQSGDSFASAEEARAYINDTLDYLVTRWERHCLQGPSHPLTLGMRSRPTAVNLADSAIKLKATAKAACEAPGSSPQSVVEAVVAEAEGYLGEDIAANRVGRSSRSVHRLALSYVLPSDTFMLGRRRWARLDPRRCCRPPPPPAAAWATACAS